MKKSSTHKKEKKKSLFNLHSANVLHRTNYNFVENLKVEKLRAALGKYPPGAASPSCSTGKDQDSRSSLDFFTGIFGLEKSRITEIVNQAMEELIKMATAGEPLWIRSVETGREILNYDEYVKEFSIKSSSNNGRPKRSIEASRETGVVFVDLPRLVQSFMDVVSEDKNLFRIIDDFIKYRDKNFKNFKFKFRLYTFMPFIRKKIILIVKSKRILKIHKDK